MSSERCPVFEKSQQCVLVEGHPGNHVFQSKKKRWFDFLGNALGEYLFGGGR